MPCSRDGLSPRPQARTGWPPLGPVRFRCVTSMEAVVAALERAKLRADAQGCICSTVHRASMSSRRGDGSGAHVGARAALCVDHAHERLRVARRPRRSLPLAADPRRPSGARTRLRDHRPRGPRADMPPCPRPRARRGVQRVDLHDDDPRQRREPALRRRRARARPRRVRTRRAGTRRPRSPRRRAPSGAAPTSSQSSVCCRPARSTSSLASSRRPRSHGASF